MIGICSKCGNHAWDKEIEGNTMQCPKCGNRWEFQKLPLFILTGCSGMGKTTTAQALQKLTEDVVVLDADMFYNLMPHETDADYYAQVEQVGSLSKNIHQSGKSVLWTMAGNIDKINHTYHCRFFEEVHILALVCEEESLRKRMMQGRGITDENWIQGSVDYNEYFKTHTKIGEMCYDILDTEGKSVSQVAMEVCVWLRDKLKGM